MNASEKVQRGSVEDGDEGRKKKGEVFRKKENRGGMEGQTQRRKERRKEE